MAIIEVKNPSCYQSNRHLFFVAQKENSEAKKARACRIDRNDDDEPVACFGLSVGAFAKLNKTGLRPESF